MSRLSITPRVSFRRALSSGLRLGCALACLLAPRPARAHVVRVDGSAAEWLGVSPNVADLAQVWRTTGPASELVWSDASSDAVVFADPSLDLATVRLAGDLDRLYVLVELAAPPVLAGAGAPQLQVAFDVDRLVGLGQLAFARGAETSVASSSAWEYLLVTRFGSGQSPMLLDGSSQPVATDVQGVLSADGVLEASIPWSAFGSVYPPIHALRLTVALFGSTAEDSTLEYGGPDSSDVADVVTDYGGAGIHPGTWIESQDGTIDDFLDVHFSPRGEVYAPVVISEVYTALFVKSEWVELYNASGSAIALGGYKLGDEETPGDNEGMGRFPAGTVLQPGEAFVVAVDGATFLSDRGIRADAEFGSTDAATPDMLPFPEWSNTTSVHLTANGDEIVLLDATGTVVDVVTYLNGSWPGVRAHGGVPEGRSMERAEPQYDTNDCALDFLSQAVPTPGDVPAVLAVGPGAGLGRLALTPNPFSVVVRLSLGADDRSASVTVLDVRGRRVCDLAPSGGTWGGSEVSWDGRDGRGRPVGAGMYLFVVRGVGGTRVGRAVLLR